MLVDVFLFNDEFAHLECRVHELFGLVDQFVAIEGNRTMQGAEKPYHLSEVAGRYDGAGLDIITVDMSWLGDIPPQTGPWVEPGTEDNWRRDRKQREAFHSEIYPEDTVFIYGDVDEIPRRETIAAYDGTASVLMLEHLFYSVKYRSAHMWPGPVIGTRAKARSFIDARYGRWGYPALPDAGWHLAWFGGEQAIERKVLEFAHGELVPEARRIAETYPRQHIRPASEEVLEVYEGDLPTWVAEGNAPDDWYLEW